MPGIAKRCRVFLPGDARHCQWMLSFFARDVSSFLHICPELTVATLCSGSQLKLPGRCQGQCQVVLGIAKRCQVFLPVMCRVLWIYVLSSQLPHYMSRQSTEASWWVPRPVPGGARHCQEIWKCHSKCRIEWPVFASAPAGALSHVSQYIVG